MKILYVHDTPISSHKANITQVVHMCQAFSELGHEVVLAVPKEKGDGDKIRKSISERMNKKIEFPIVFYPKFTVGSKFSLLGGLPGANCILKSSRADLCFLRNPVFVLSALRANIKTIFESHSSLLNERHKTIDVVLKWTLIRKSRHNKLLKFICISDALAFEWLSKGVPEEKIVVAHDGVDFNAFSDYCDRDVMRREIGLTTAKKIVVYAGSLYENRGIDTILSLAAAFDDVTFVIVGGPEERAQLYRWKCHVANINNTIFTGYIRHCNVRKYLFAADVLLMIWSDKVKTINFCSPLKMFEYMAAGRVIVGHSYPTIKEVLTDGVDAYLADPASFDDLRTKLRLALNQDHPSPIALAARKLALEKYSWKARAEVILKSICEEKYVCH